MARRRPFYIPDRPPLTDRWFIVTYHYEGDHPWATYEHRDIDPVRLVQWMTVHFHGSAHIHIKRLFEEGPDDGRGRSAAAA